MITNNEEKRHCCHLECENNAKWQVYYSDHYEDYSDFCDVHLLRHLPEDGTEVKLTAIKQEDNKENLVQ